MDSKAIVAVISALAGLFGGIAIGSMIGSNIWQGQHTEARHDLRLCRDLVEAQLDLHRVLSARLDMVEQRLKGFVTEGH